MQLQQQGLSQRAACRAVALSRSVLAYQRREQGDEAIIAVLQELAERFPDHRVLALAVSERGAL